jgi:integrase
MKIKGLYKFANSKFYWYRWTEERKRKAVSLQTDDLAQAITKVKQIQAGAAFARWEKATPVRTEARRMAEDYLKTSQSRPKKPLRPEVAKTRRYILQKFLADAEVRDVSQITHSSVSNWIAGLKDSGLSPDTVHTYARTIKTFVGYLEDLKVVRRGLKQELEVPEFSPVGRKNWLKSEECDRLIREAKSPDLAFVLYCGFHAGLRRNEISQAKVGWFDLQAGLLHVQNDVAAGFVLKDRENRTVPLTKEFHEFLRVFLADRDAGSYAIAPHKNKGVSRYRYDFNKTFRTHVEKCGVVCTVHDMRRSFASNLVSHGVSIYKVARWLGDGVQVVERSYGHLAPADSDIDRLTAKVA